MEHLATPPARIALLTTPDARRYALHLARGAQESGRGETPIYRIRSASEPVDVEALIPQLEMAWEQPVRTPGWRRAYGLVVGPDIKGHLELYGGTAMSDQHRAMLGMGLETGLRRQGLGTILLTTAIEWSRGQGLEWLDLGVFVHNTPAQALYRRHGFVETGRVADRFRIDGQVIDDISMTLRL